MDLPSAVSNVDSTLTRVTQTPSEIRSDRLLVAYSTHVEQRRYRDIILFPHMSGKTFLVSAGFHAFTPL